MLEKTSDPNDLQKNKSVERIKKLKLNSRDKNTKIEEKPFSPNKIFEMPKSVKKVSNRPNVALSHKNFIDFCSKSAQPEYFDKLNKLIAESNEDDFLDLVCLRSANQSISKAVHVKTLVIFSHEVF